MSPENNRLFDHLSRPNENLRLLRPVDLNLSQMRQELVDAGIDLTVSEKNRKSLEKSKFQSLKTGRGPAMVAVLGRDKAVALLSWCQQRSEGGPLLKKHGKITEGSQGRGLRQLSADLIQLLANSTPSQADLDTFCLRTNQRVRKGLLWENKSNDEAKDQIRAAFSGVPEAETTFSSIPSGSLADLWDFLITK